MQLVLIVLKLLPLPARSYRSYSPLTEYLFSCYIFNKITQLKLLCFLPRE